MPDFIRGDSHSMPFYPSLSVTLVPRNLEARYLFSIVICSLHTNHYHYHRTFYPSNHPSIHASTHRVSRTTAAMKFFFSYTYFVGNDIYYIVNLGMVNLYSGLERHADPKFRHPEIQVSPQKNSTILTSVC